MRQTVPPADLEIVEIVGRGDLDRAAAGLGVGIFVGDDRDEPVGERQAHHLPTRSAKRGSLGMDGDPGVAEHRLRPGRRDGDEAARLPSTG